MAVRGGAFTLCSSPKPLYVGVTAPNALVSDTPQPQRLYKRVVGEFNIERCSEEAKELGRNVEVLLQSSVLYVISRRDYQTCDCPWIPTSHCPRSDILMKDLS